MIPGKAKQLPVIRKLLVKDSAQQKLGEYSFECLHTFRWPADQAAIPYYLLGDRKGFLAQWVANSVAAYNEGEYGQWEAYIYYPGGNLQPIITVLPPDTIGDYPGWIKIKKTDLSGNNLSGATFGIYYDSGCQEGTEVATFVTTADEWTYFDVSDYMDSATQTFTQTFYLKEISAPDDYVANSKGYSVTVSSTNNSTQETAAAVNGGVAIKNGLPQPPEGVVNKVDQDGNGIGPATFHFKSLTNSVDADFETDENGELQFQWTDPDGEDYIPPGEYTVTEVIPPPGYEKSDEAQNLRLWIEDIDGVPTPMHSGPIVFENKPLHSVIIQKVDESGNGLPGAVFEVYCNGALVTNITTGADGTFTFAGTDGNGLTNGTWEFVEVKAPDGYLLPYNKVQRVTINTEHDDVLIHELTFVNYTYPEIVIKKVAAGEEQPLAGAVFEVMIDGTNIGTYGPTGPDGTIVINHDVYGKFLENDNQDTWTVGVREVVAPDGYLIDDPDWQFAEIHRGTELQPFVFTDTKYPEIHILKRDRDTGDPVAGTSFKVEINGVDIGTFVTTGEDGIATITYEDYKRFLGDINGDEVSQDGWGVTVTEVEVTPGYNKDLQPESGDFSITKHLQPNQSVLEFVFEDTPYRDLLIRKYDSTNSWLLQGAHFYLESITLENPEAAGPDGVVTADGVTNENGELLFEDLPNGTYKLTEITPPTGYDLADPHEWEVVISSNSKPVVLVEAENHPREGLLITKHDAITNKPLANVEFMVRYLGDGNETTDTSNEARPYCRGQVPLWADLRRPDPHLRGADWRDGPRRGVPHHPPGWLYRGYLHFR